jgi:hypothetical protein
MDHKKRKAMAAKLAKDLKTPEDLSQLSAFLTKLTLEAAVESSCFRHQYRRLKRAFWPVDCSD